MSKIESESGKEHSLFTQRLKKAGRVVSLPLSALTLAALLSGCVPKPESLSTPTTDLRTINDELNVMGFALGEHRITSHKKTGLGENLIDLSWETSVGEDESSLTPKVTIPLKYVAVIADNTLPSGQAFIEFDTFGIFSTADMSKSMGKNMHDLKGQSYQAVVEQLIDWEAKAFPHNAPQPFLITAAPDVAGDFYSSKLTFPQKNSLKIDKY